MYKKDSNKMILLYIALHVIWWCIYFYIGHITPYYEDDLMYQGRNNLKEVWDLMHHFYMTNGGRAWGYLLVGIFCNLLPKDAYNALNAAMIVLMAFMLEKLVFSTKLQSAGEERFYKNISLKWRIITSGLIYFMIWFFTKPFNETLIWTTGSILYVWSNAMILLFMYCFVNFDTLNVKHAMLLLILGIPAGLSVENSACSLVFMLFIFCFFVIRGKGTSKKLLSVRFFGIIGVLIGFAILMIAPGNYARSADASDYESANIFIRYAYRITRETYYLLIYGIVIIGILICATIFARYCWKKGTPSTVYKREITNFIYDHKEESLLILGAFASIYAMTFSAGFAKRIYFTAFLWTIIVIGRLIVGGISNLNIDIQLQNVFRNILSVLIMALFVLVFVELITGYLYTLSDSSAVFDRQTVYYLINSGNSLLPGNGYNR